jgi:hypothetical protein
MPRWRSADVEALLGAPIDENGLTESALAQLVANQVRENEQLDFKGEMYARRAGASASTWSEEQEFAKDVACFANHRGGLILIGVRDTSQVASGLNPILNTTGEAEERRLRQALTNYLAPPTDTIFITIPAAGGGFYLAVIVPPSRRAPHAVVGSPGDARRPLVYPVRHGADTIWLTESEVAQRHRTRIERETNEQKHADDVVQEGLDSLRRASGAWLYVAVVPDSVVPGEVTTEWLNATDEWWRNNLPTSPLGRSVSAFGRALAAPGRATFTGARLRDTDDEADPRDAYVEFYVDGSAFVATPISERTDEDAETHEIGEQTLTDDVVLLVDAGLRWCSRQVGSWGTARAIAGIIDADAQPGALDQPLILVAAAYGEMHRGSATRTVRRPPITVTIVDLSAVETMTQRLAVTHTLLAGLLQWFGRPEPRHIARDGALRAGAWRSADQVRRWAAHHGVPCT